MPEVWLLDRHVARETLDVRDDVNPCTSSLMSEYMFSDSCPRYEVDSLTVRERQLYLPLSSCVIVLPHALAVQDLMY
jgi:hypothetical protein